MAKAKQEQQEPLVMSGIKHELDCHGKPVELLILADLHIGDKNANFDVIKKLIKGVRDNQNRYAVLAGDLMNTAIIGGKSDVYGEVMKPSEQLTTCSELLDPIKEKILCITAGNHEERISKTAGVDMTRLLARELGIEEVYSDTTALMFLKFGHKANRAAAPLLYSFYISHGNGGGGKRAGSKINSLEDLANVISVDCYVCGHTHLPATFKRMHYTAYPPRFCAIAHEQLFVNTASALNYGGYGRRNGYTPGSNSYPVITLDNTRHHMTATL